MRLSAITDFLRLESASGIILFVMAVFALILSNSPWANLYHALFEAPLEIRIGSVGIDKPLLFWINEGLMTIFFLLVGLELKREFIEGELSKVSQVILPGLAALGGMIVPAMIYVMCNRSNPMALSGWAVPVATDIAFALGVLSLFGKRVPLGLKLFLMALAIFDDVGAIIIIAIYHTQSLSYISLLLAALIIVILQILNRIQVQLLGPYILLGLILWLCVLQSGVHATVAGVLLAFMIPMNKNLKSSPLHRLQSGLHAWVAFLVMPLFAFANAGLSFSGLSLNIFLDSIVIGIALGLFLGKQVGVVIFSWLMIRLGFAKLPADTSWLQMYGAALLCGIGFTMSLFLGTLAFQGNDVFLTEVRIGVLGGSMLSGIVGSVVLHYALRKRNYNLG